MLCGDMLCGDMKRSGDKGKRITNGVKIAWSKQEQKEGSYKK